MKKILTPLLLGLISPAFCQPIIKIQSTTLGVPNNQLFWVKIIFTEPVNGFNLFSTEIINGTALDLRTNSTTESEIQIRPDTSEGMMSMVIPAGAVTSKANGEANNSSNTLKIQSLNPGLRPSSNFDLSQFALNTPLPIGGDKNINISPEVLNGDPTRNTGYTNAPYFHTDSVTGSMNFFAPLNGATTDSNYPRSELREDDDNEWKLSTYTSNTLTASVMVTQMPPAKRKIVIGQIHGTGLTDKFGTPAPDVPLLKMIYDTNQSYRGQICAGCIRAQYRQTPVTGINNQTDIVLGSRIPLNTLFTYSIVLKNDGTLMMTGGGKNATVKLSTSTNNKKGWGTQKLYFKAGVYLQEEGTSSTQGGKAKFFYFNMNHQS